MNKLNRDPRLDVIAKRLAAAILSGKNKAEAQELLREYQRIIAPPESVQVAAGVRRRRRAS